jgi:hypothetical protein
MPDDDTAWDDIDVTPSGDFTWGAAQDEDEEDDEEKKEAARRIAQCFELYKIAIAGASLHITLVPSSSFVIIKHDMTDEEDKNDFSKVTIMGGMASDKDHAVKMIDGLILGMENTLDGIRDQRKEMVQQIEDDEFADDCPVLFGINPLDEDGEDGGDEGEEDDEAGF